MSYSDGTWERVVADVVIAGQPRVVYTLAQHTKGMADAIPEHAGKLATLVNDLCERKDGWHGRAADEFQDVVARIAHEIGALSDDLTVLAGQLDGAAAKLSEAIAHIPVPLTKTSSWGWDVDHELPNHTPMDDSLHDPDTFKTALVADYTKDPARYQDFLALVDDPVTGRTATAHDANYRAVPHAQLPQNTPTYDLPSHQAAERANRLAHWYSHNASLALHWQTELANDYQDRRDEIHFNSNADLQKPDRSFRDGSWTTAPPVYPPAPAPSDVIGMRNSQRDSMPRTTSSKVLGEQHVDPSPGWQRAFSDAHDTGLASASLTSADGALTGSPHVGGLGSLPDGVLSPGSAISGPDQGPTSPLTSADQALSSSETGGSTAQPTSSSPMGFMPTGGSQLQKSDERRTWLTEDEDYWSAPLGPPSLIE